ncbi:DUF2804 family protein [Treponema sp.]|uniref:DUF2804 family protein n=1 Tax=Treponema sp. TaxID=166 RepID=UPI0025CF10B2|nr:DUF2804 family protein [Treponema sp.]MCR5217684.1 DUF2804 domain-containing protein [Treponema sp.]
MYTREILEQPGKFVKNGIPVFGTFKGHPDRLDIRGVKNPYSFHFPKFLSNLRIKSRLSLYFSVGDYIGHVNFLDAKIFGFAEVVFWNAKTLKKFVYHSVMGPRKRFVPHDMNVAATGCYMNTRYIRISWDRKSGRISLNFKLKGDSVRPSVSASLNGRFSDNLATELTSILPSPTMRRCTGKYNAGFSLKGSITVTYKKQAPQTMAETEGLGFLDINRTYMKVHNQGEFITGIGSCNDKPVLFRIESTSQEAANPDRYNGNMLFYDGKVTVLPPVVITHPFGIKKDWVIQDTENMIDLSFTPSSDNINRVSIFLLKAVYNTIFGKLEGTLATCDGEKISFKGFNGISQKYNIRL